MNQETCVGFHVKGRSLLSEFTNKLEHWYVRHNNIYSLHPWATCFNLYTGHMCIG